MSDYNRVIVLGRLTRDPELKQVPSGTAVVDMEHAAQFAEAGIPFIFDPGQGLPMFDGEELQKFVGQATWVAVNDYEGKLLSERTGWTLQEIAAQVEALIVTRGGSGSTIFSPMRFHPS